MRRTRTIAIDPVKPEAAEVSYAARLLRQGALVAFPTETVYGLGAHARDATAIAELFEAKGRPADNPLIVHVASVAQARALTSDWTDAADALAAAFWPGPLTLVVARGEGLPDAVTAGLDSVAVRIPDHPVASALLAAAGVPVAAPSANPSGSVSPTTAAHVLAGLDGKIDLVLDGGSCSVGIESTVVDVRATPRVLRRGMVGLDALRAVVPAVEDVVDGGGPARSPGMSTRHYAPRARVILDATTPTGSVARLTRGSGGDVRVDDGPDGVVLTLPSEPAGYAACLYAALHQVDALGCDTVVVEPLPADPAWDAIRDRLRRAAAGVSEP